MRKECKKQYMGILIFLIILLCIGFLTLVVKAGNEKKAGNTTYAMIYTMDDKDLPDMTRMDYQKNDLERSMQETIQLMVEDTNPIVTISNYNSSDCSETTVTVDLHINDGKDISKENKEDIERFVLGCFNGLLRDNIIIKANEK